MAHLEQLADNVWVVAQPLSFFGLHLGARMTVVKMRDGTLTLYSPVAMDEALAAEVDVLGDVANIVAPNRFHHLHVGPTKARYPDAALHVCRSLLKKRKDLKADAVLGGFDWPDELACISVGGTLIDETVFVHTDSNTLICCDLLENFQEMDHFVTRVYLKANGAYKKATLFRDLRLAFTKRSLARRAIDEILEHPIEAISVAHGEPVDAGGHAIFEAAYQWLR